VRKVWLSALVVLAMVLSLVPVSAGTISDGHTWGLENTDIARAVDIDGQGNVYIAGASNAALAGNDFLAKFDASGQLVWDRILVAPGSMDVYDLAVDDAGNAYLCGELWNSTNGAHGGFVAKISSDGTLVFDRLIEGSILCREIETDSQGVVVAGDWDWGPAVAALTSSGDLRWFVYGGSALGSAYPWGLAVDSSDNVFITMDRYDDESDVGFAKFDSEGNLVRQVAYRSYDPEEYSWDVMAGSDGYVYGLGWSISEELLFLVKMTPSLDFVWGEKIGDPLSYQECWKMVGQPDGTLYAIGRAVDSSVGVMNPALFHVSSSGLLLEASYYGIGSFEDAAALPMGGFVLAGSSYGVVDLTPMPLPGMIVTPVSDMMVDDVLVYESMSPVMSSGHVSEFDPAAFVDSYDPALWDQAWFGYVDRVISQIQVDISVRQSNSDPSSCAFRGTASGGDRPYSFTWNFGDGTSDTGARVTHIYGGSGTYHVTLSAVDSVGAVGYAWVDVIVPGPPVIIGTTCYPMPAIVNGITTFEVQAYDPDGGAIAGYDWDFGDGWSASTSIGVVEHVYTSPGVFTMNVAVTDDEGSVAFSSLSVEVIEFNSVPWAYFTVTPIWGNVTTVFTVDASNSNDTEDPTSALKVRWDWEADGYWDTNWTTEKVAYHTYSAVGTYVILLEVMDTGGLSNYAAQQVAVTSGDLGTVLDEHFDSYASLDPGWTFWNYTGADYNHFEITNGTLFATNAAGWDAHDSWNARANWTGLVLYNGSLTVSFWLYLPTESDYKEGYWGQWEGLLFYDLYGNPLLITRWLMDLWSGAPSGWSYIDNNSAWAGICSFTAGWHEVEIVMNKSMSTWTAVFDGVSYPGQSYTGSAAPASDVSMISFVNGLREETVVVMVDDLLIQRDQAVGPYNLPPVASFTVAPQYAYVGDPVTFDASESYDPDGTIVEWGWEYGDGTEGGDMIISHPFSAAGLYTTTLTVRDNQGATDTATSTVVVLEPGNETSWTFLVYEDGDNNLEDVALLDFLEMSSVGSTDQVNIVVQLDRVSYYSSDYGDWTGTKRFYVTPGMTPIASNALMDLGELNMGDPAVLMDFIEWGVMSFPADKYMLVLWDHGGGWDGAVCWDETDYYDALTLDELEWALNMSEIDTGEWIDSVGFDACLMGMAEVAFEIRHMTDVLVFSEESIPWDGWPYNTIMADLVANPLMSPLQLGGCIVQRYAEFYGSEWSETLSVADVISLRYMYADLDVFASELISSLAAYKPEIIEAVGATEFFSYLDYRDLYDFAYEVRTRVPESSLQSAADAVMGALNASIVSNFAGAGHPDAYGLSIELPPSASWYYPSYEDLDMSAELMWDDFIKAFIQSAADAYEPDDTYLEANWLDPYLAQTHSIDDMGADVDWVTFTLNASTQVRVSTSGPEGMGDSVLRLYNASGVPYSPIAENDDTNNSLWSQITIWLGAGQYWVEVSAYDYSEEIPSYDLLLEFGPFPSEPPVPQFAIYGEFFVGGYVYFEGGYSFDPDGYIVSYSWDLGDGSYANESWASHVYSYAGDFIVSLTVEDNDGLTATAFGWITISPGNMPPVPIGIITPANPSVGETVTFDASMSYDPDGYIVNWFWYFGDGYYAYSQVATHAYTSTGTYYVELDVCDNYGTWRYTSFNVTVRESEPVPPVAVIAYEPSQPLVGQLVVFDGTYSLDPDGSITDFIWQFGDGDVGFGAQVTHVYENYGTFVVSLTVIDDYGMSDETTTTIKVVSMPTAEFQYSPLMPIAGQVANFYAWGSSDQSGIVEYLWSFGDGTFASGWQATHTFAAAGSYVVTLTVRNADGMTASHSEVVTVVSAQLVLIYDSSGANSAEKLGGSPSMAFAWVALLGLCSGGTVFVVRARRR